MNSYSFQEEPKEWNPRVLDPDSMSSSSLSGKRSDQRFLRLLSLIPFQTEAEERPELEVFDWTDLDAVMARCEVKLLLFDYSHFLMCIPIYLLLWGGLYYQAKLP